MNVSAHFMHRSYFHEHTMHETLLPCMNHGWFMHGDMKHACDKYTMHEMCMNL